LSQSGLFGASGMVVRFLFGASNACQIHSIAISIQVLKVFTTEDTELHKGTPQRHGGLLYVCSFQTSVLSSVRLGALCGEGL
jgi:hypothetical protein